MKKKLVDMLQFLSQQTTSITSAELANALDISTRSVKNFVHEINSLYGTKIILSSRTGYTLNPKSNISLLLNEDNDTPPSTNEERSFYIIKQLFLNHTSKVEIFDLCDYLCIGYSTVRSLISKMNKTFSSYHVEFTCENEQVQIKGSEQDKRKLISYVINEEYKNSFINADNLMENFADLDIPLLQSIIQDTFQKNNFYLNDFSFTNILLHLSIIIDRALSGNQLNSGRTDFHFDTEQEKQLLYNLKQQLESNFDISLNNYELFEIYMLFKANANYSLNAFSDELTKIVGNEIVDLTEKYVHDINNYYMIDLSSNAFKTPFSLHLKNLIFRASQHRYTSNAMAQVIRTNSPLVFDIAIFISLDLMERFNILVNEDETAFLAMHIGAEIERQNESKNKIPVVLICPDYHNMAQQITNTLLINFGNQINLLDCLHHENQIKEVKNQIAIIFSLIPLSIKPEANQMIVYLSPLNLSSQFETIQNALTKSSESYKDYTLRLNFHEYFEEDLFVINDNFKTKEQVLTYLCDRLSTKNYVDSNFEEKVYQRENAATTAFGNIAIPHTVDMNAIKTSISVCISKKGIQWGKNTVYIVLLLAINKADRRQFRYLYESLISIFTENNIVQEVRNCNSFKQFENFVYSWIEQKENE